MAWISMCVCILGLTGASAQLMSGEVYSETKPIDEATLKIVMDVKSDILFHLASMNLNITKFVPVKYRTSQVGTKTNYLVKIEIFPGYYIHVTIHRYSFGTPSFDDLRAGKSLSDILEPF